MIRVNCIKRKESVKRFEAWWISPFAPLIIVFLLVLISFFQSSSAYVNEYKSNKWISSEYVVIAALLLITVALGCYFGKNGKERYYLQQKQKPLNRRRLLTAFWIITAICLIAYTIWFANFARLHGLSAFLSVFSTNALASNMYDYRLNSGSISGITTFTEVGVIAFVIGAMLIQSESLTRSDQRKIKLLLIIMILLSIERALLFSERIAVIELIVPFAIVWFCSSKKELGFWDKWIPVLAIVTLMVVFAIFEYSRSWLTHYHSYYNSYLDFISIRLFGYYTNAFNTEAMFVRFGDTSWLPYWSVQWFWQIPGMSSVYSSVADPNIAEQYSSLLKFYANAEYNNPGGVLTFFKDFSWFGIFPNFIFGYLIGRAYSGIRHSDPLSLMMFPVFYLTLLEMPRYFYLGVNRGFVVVITILLVMLICGREKNLSDFCIQKEEEHNAA